jgi:hypothetical protein
LSSTETSIPAGIGISSRTGAKLQGNECWNELTEIYQQHALKRVAAHQPGACRDAGPIPAPVSAHARWMELQRGIGNQAALAL